MQGVTSGESWSHVTSFVGTLDVNLLTVMVTCALLGCALDMEAL